MNEISNMALFGLFRARDARLMATIERLSRQIVWRGRSGRTCRHHPDNGGNCRFHAWPGNCDSDVFYPPLHPDRMAAVDNPEGPRPRVGVPFSQGEP